MDGDDIMPTFRQKFELNSQELLFFNQEIESWQRDLKGDRCKKPMSLEDIGFALCSDDETQNDEVGQLVKGGKECLKSGAWSRAISYFSSAVSKQSGNSRHYMNRAAAYLKRNMLVEAETDCSRAIHLEPDNAKAHLRRACIRKQLGKYKESCDDIEDVMRIEPGNKTLETEYESILEYWINQIIKCRDHNENDDLSNEKLDLALKLKSRGNELIKMEKYKLAGEKFTLAIKLNPNDPTYYANRAICHMKTKQFIQAEKDCTAALSLNRAYVKIYQRRARIRQSIGKLDEAREDLYSALLLRPTDTDIEKEFFKMSFERANRLKPRAIGSKQTKLLTEITGVSQNHETDNINQTEMNEMDLNHVSKEKANFDNTNGAKNQIKHQSKNSVLDITQYDVREVFPLRQDHPSGKYSGPLIKIWAEDSTFVLPDKLFEIPEKFRKMCLSY